MPRTDRASLVLDAPPAAIYAAFVDPTALAVWLPPAGMSARFEHFDARAGGGYRLILTYADPSDAPGKSAADADVVDARFTELEPGVRVVQEIDFVSDDPAFAGTMRMTWEVTALDHGSRVDIIAEDVPDGIDAADHAVGLTSSLQNLATYLATGGGGGSAVARDLGVA